MLEQGVYICPFSFLFMPITVSQDGSKVLSGGANNAARMFDTTTGQSQQVAQHDAPVKVVRWVDAQGGILATGSWDKTLKVMSSYFSFILPPCQPHVETHTNIQYWDLRQSTPVVSVQLPERCYTMDVH